MSMDIQELGTFSWCTYRVPTRSYIKSHLNTAHTVCVSGYRSARDPSGSLLQSSVLLSDDRYSVSAPVCKDLEQKRPREQQ